MSEIWRELRINPLADDGAGRFNDGKRITMELCESRAHKFRHYVERYRYNGDSSSESRPIRKAARQIIGILATPRSQFDQTNGVFAFPRAESRGWYGSRRRKSARFASL